jgi:hypothetical protein
MERSPDSEGISAGAGEASAHEGGLPPPPARSATGPPATEGPPAARTDGFAIAALILGIFGILGLVFGVIALRRIRRTDARGRGMAIAGIVLSCFWILIIAAAVADTIFGSAERSPGGAVTVAGDVALSDLRVGDCVPSLPTGTVVVVRVVPCSDPHAGEVYNIASLPAGPYPGDDQVRRLSVGECQGALPRYVSAPPGTTGYDISYLMPLETSWSSEGNRSVICIAHDPSKSPLVGSIQGRGSLRH